MLAVDRQDPPAPALERCERQIAGRDEALLVGEREVDARLERGQRRREPGEADDSVQDDVGRAGLDERVERRVAAHGDVGDAAACSRSRAPRSARLPAATAHELELRVSVDDLDRLAADRAGSAEQGDALHRLKCRDARAARQSGAASNATST